jgi:YidC/Oxa1 family membrane protein insertase
VFDLLIVAPLTNLVLGFYYVLGENLGLAIILFTICLRIVLLPLTIRQIRQQKKMAELQPRLKELQGNRKDPNQMTPEEAALMRQTAGSCLGGCLPLLIQIPILIGLNHVIGKIASAQSGDIFNNLLYFDALKHEASYRFHTMFLGFDLAGVPSKIGIGAAFIPYGAIIALLVVTQYFQSKLMLIMQKKKPAVSTKKKANEKRSDINPKQAEKVEMQEEMQKMMQMQTTYLIPVMIGFASYSFTAALSLYWLTQNIFAIVQMYVQNRMLDAEHVEKKFEKEVKIAEEEVIKEAEYEDVIDAKLEASEAKELKKDSKKKKKGKAKKSKR